MPFRMDLEDCLDEAKRHLEEAENGFPATLYVYQRGHLVGLASCGVPRFLVVSVAAVAVDGFEADELVLVAESYGTSAKTNPEGRPWKSGEMQRHAHEPAVAALLNESVQVWHASKGVPVEALVAKYRRVDGVVQWTETTLRTPVRGLLPEKLRAAVEARPTPATGAWDPATWGLSPPEAELHRRIGTVRAIYMAADVFGLQVVCGLAHPDDEWAVRVVNDSFARAGFRWKSL
jgi:hypothetical protein